MQAVIENILINYEFFGNKNNNTILILHGWGRNTNDWVPTAKRLSDTNKIILIDLPGFGGSSIPDQKSLDTFEYAEIIDKFIAKLKLKKITLIGHSFGGKISTVVASQNKHIKKLILVDASGVEDKPLSVIFKKKIYKLFKPFINLAPTTVKESLFDSFASADYKNVGNLKESFKKIVSQNVKEAAKKITANTLIIWGENDTEVPIAAAKTFKSLISNSILRIVWRANHDPHLQKPEKFIEILKEFI